MLEFFHKIAEERIQEDIRNGGFDNLEGAGKPLPEDDTSMIPEDLRMAFKIMKNAGCLPPEMQEKKDIQNAIDLLETMEDEEERYRQIQKLNYLVTQVNIRRNRPLHFEEDQIYYQRVVERLTVRKRS